MRAWFKNFKKMAREVDFFWQTTVFLFLLSSIIVFVVCVVWGLRIEQSLSHISPSEEGDVEEKLTIDTIAKISDEIEARANRMIKITDNPSTISDPSR